MFTKIDWMWSKAIETIFFHPLQTKTFRVVDITFAASLSIFCTLMSACCSMVKTSCVTQFKVTTCVGGVVARSTIHMQMNPLHTVHSPPHPVSSTLCSLLLGSPRPSVPLTASNGSLDYTPTNQPPVWSAPGSACKNMAPISSSTHGLDRVDDCGGVRPDRKVRSHVRIQSYFELGEKQLSFPYCCR